MIKKLHVYAGAEHNHAAQQPKALEIKVLIFEGGRSSGYSKILRNW